MQDRALSRRGSSKGGGSGDGSSPSRPIRRSRSRRAGSSDSPAYAAEVDTPVNPQLHEQLAAELEQLRAAGTYKRFNTLTSPMAAAVRMEGRGEVIVLS